jgi:catechol 2,3-dioxygenase-like lactoylglutathione lyase family enzyme
VSDRITANLPSRDFDATIAFYGRLGFEVAYRDDHWLILERGALELEFFPYPDLDPASSSFSACIRVDDLDWLYADFCRAGLSTDPRATPRLTPPEQRPGIPRMFALVDPDGSLLRCLSNSGEDG